MSSLDNSARFTMVAIFCHRCETPRPAYSILNGQAHTFPEGWFLVSSTDPDIHGDEYACSQECASALVSESRPTRDGSRS